MLTAKIITSRHTETETLEEVLVLRLVHREEERRGGGERQACNGDDCGQGALTDRRSHETLRCHIEYSITKEGI